MGGDELLRRRLFNFAEADDLDGARAWIRSLDDDQLAAVNALLPQLAASSMRQRGITATVQGIFSAVAETEFVELDVAAKADLATAFAEGAVAFCRIAASEQPAHLLAAIKFGIERDPDAAAAALFYVIAKERESDGDPAFVQLLGGGGGVDAPTR